MKGATYTFIKEKAVKIISIHAPVKGATHTFGDIKVIAFLISIHAPVKGATGTSLFSSTGTEHFNPRTREGCDLNKRFCGAYDALISIHAPVKGATGKALDGYDWPGIFQSTHP